MYFEQNTNTRTVYGVQWKKLEKEEMYVFIALHILTGLVKCSRITDYWSNNILCAGPKVFNKSIMSRNRYLSILKFIRFSPPEAARNNAPLSRLGIYMSMLKDNCKTLVDPGPVDREVILDNWYTSVRLSQFLLTQGTYLTGTIRSNRGVPAQLTRIPLERYQSCFVRKDMQLLVRYKDKKDVYLLTSKHSAGFFEKSRYMVGGKQVHFKKPAHIEFYNQNMGSVDAVDQDLEPYNSLRKSYTWFTKVGFQLMLQMLLNSKVLFCNAKDDFNISMYDYIKLCCNGILHKYSEGYRCMTDASSCYNQPSTSKKTQKEHVMVNLPKEDEKNGHCERSALFAENTTKGN
ncbi:unnamed protein product [Acanthoscelides obtectus]|uniref:PiggyBac transposable element-derived protein domain-containing protein n=1 Tax=Acanthoscelides obtectus TaxID=200917 RepID=A0A9P0P2C9_ACAOB|nr:unnamed protein product [Acanthoscelides obtectus]CAK1676713.1 PiggyBac transposable element-derived protein 4 [Acanthoscelides obtectus]